MWDYVRRLLQDAQKRLREECSRNKPGSTFHLFKYPPTDERSHFLKPLERSKFTRSNKQSNSTLWSLPHCLWASSFVDHLDHCRIVFEHVELVERELLGMLGGSFVPLCCWSCQNIEFTNHNKSGRPLLAKYKHFMTIWAHTAEGSPAVSKYSGGIWWSSMHGVATCWREDRHIFLCEFAASLNAFLGMTFHIIALRAVICSNESFSFFLIFFVNPPCRRQLFAQLGFGLNRLGDQPLPLFACSLNTLDCDLQGRKTNFTNSKPLVSQPTVLSITFDLPECKEPFEKNEKKWKQTKNWEQEDEKKRK